MKVVITGGAGLVGTHACELYARQGHEVIAIDNFMRAQFFGGHGNTHPNRDYLLSKFPQINFQNADVRDAEKISELIKGADFILHTAAQPSHPRSIEIPLDDFSVNAFGTVQLLELTRKHADNAVFVFCSTDKVYGENSNTIPTVVEKETRYDYTDRDGIDETMPIDNTIHTPF